mmetsp:Transcript_14627/g.19793  ORF Transcript_14627/g.19793 Transcript_14627/m.19793 type:complete len:126 (+) Transcript_14627:1281-1658(+)|eukprot:CAMPEP_0185578198 /NCGR_PEP_ID=MMETSP0434-20130131/12292_1 /TAXON_ID=626734 ORGANISM="Favella taraikaensis, Strain Fe Narragansett Bay" /NCGR_SAMPLE_ID=MMETSP0434 /ASSEMBLY_ACC=CAM_ASM_000379 /LENGTH=125 /DNA_ID=CAMNT_0028195951 /DNA_START=1281 /DNA_END=1658 /DNA_ORIENTATION=+
MGGTTRLTAISRINEPPKPDCVVCSDDSASIAIIKIRSCSETKLATLIDNILPECLQVKPDGYLLVDFSGKIIYERDEDMSEDEVLVLKKRLLKTLGDLGFKSNSRFMLQADLAMKTENGASETV